MPNRWEMDTDQYHLELTTDTPVAGEELMITQLMVELRAWKTRIPLVDLKFQRTAPDVYDYVVNFDAGRSNFNQINGTYVEGELVPSVTNVRRLCVSLTRVYGIDKLEIVWV